MYKEKKKSTKKDSGNGTKFYKWYGSQIAMSENNTAAYRTLGYSNGIVFNNKCLKPGEICIVEILENSELWDGYLRLGITQVNPRIFKKLTLPMHSFPELLAFGSVWSFSVTMTTNPPFAGDTECMNIKITDDCIQTCHGSYPKSVLKNDADFAPYEVGSRVGVLYIPATNELADLFFILNGEIRGPVAIDIPFKERPLFPLFDVYGRTKKIKIVDLKPACSLKQLCRQKILNCFRKTEIHNCWLPQPLKEYLSEWNA